MGDIEDTCASLRAQIAATEAQLAGLKRELENAEQVALKARAQDVPNPTATVSNQFNEKRRWPLLDEEYRRYGRQMIVPQMGLQGEWDSFRSTRKFLFEDSSFTNVCS
jgi:adenylyltransferase/sulfurtransferase